MKYIFIATTIFFGVGFFACNSNNVYNKYIEINKKKWKTEDILTFRLPELEISKQYNFEIRFRHTIEYKYKNIYLFLNMIYKNNEEIKDTIEIDLAEKNGKWKGFGVGYIREHSHKVAPRSNYNNLKQIKIEQAMRYGEKEKIESLSEVVAVGIKINKTQ